MSKPWRWFFGILIAAALVGLLAAGRSNRQAYRVAHGAIEQRVTLSQEKIDTAVQMATASVDLALKLSGDLPAQQAEAEVVKQGIQKVGDTLNSAAEARGDLAIQRLNASIEAFNSTLQAVDKASKQASDPAVKATLDRIYGALEAAREALVQTILNTQK